MKNENQLEEIYMSYINGNKNFVKETVKKWTKNDRKALYKYVCFEANNAIYSDFFFELI